MKKTCNARLNELLDLVDKFGRTGCPQHEFHTWTLITRYFYPLSALVGTKLAYNPHHQLTYFRKSNPSPS
jgi:hypothetical protein